MVVHSRIFSHTRRDEKDIPTGNTGRIIEYMGMITEAQSLCLSVHVQLLSPFFFIKPLRFSSFCRSVCGAEEQKRTCEMRKKVEQGRKEEKRIKRLRRAEKKGVERILIQVISRKTIRSRLKATGTTTAQCSALSTRIPPGMRPKPTHFTSSSSSSRACW